MRKVSILGALLLSGCVASHGVYQPPVVDMTGVDPAKYQKDANECTVAKKNATFVGNAQFISNCMEAKGYVILEKNG